ncbi:MAG: hypothetical protein ACO3YU_02620 [Candidatus Nanopelagicales bacterium]
MVASAYVLRSLAGVSAASLLVASLTSCSRPVAVQAPTLGPGCESIMAAAPIRLLGELQRETSPRNAAAIAWGDPPIVLVCGVARSTLPDAQVIAVDGVEWIAESTDAGTVFTTLVGDPVLQVRVPVDYRPEIDALAEITSVLPVS